MTLSDQQQRDFALDHTQSFIVQAPAGSGKTELLSQRFLVLLSKVKQPEEILAITFTKKSAAEMRTRILNALTRAKEENEPVNEHAKKTWFLAKKALARDTENAWHLLENPNRLQIQTIDSFNSSITRQLPLLSHFGGTIDIADDPTLLYQAAIKELFSHLEDNSIWAQSLAKLLLHLDNDLEKAEKLLMSMLAKRDQWLPTLTANRPTPELRCVLEKNLSRIITEHLNKLHQAIPKKNEILRLLQFAANHVTKDHPIYCCKELNAFPNPDPTDMKYWSAIFKLLFTHDKSSNQINWRKKFDKNIGFPPSEKTYKQAITDLLEALTQDEKLKDLFMEFVFLPVAHYEDDQWEIVGALQVVLTLAAAQLTIVFRQFGKIDYIENAQAALRALGEEDNPTDIALAFDYKIQHLLIDEFQDTSVSQYHLLKKLTASWQTEEGRTLFLVGDPMQSIYRFREAEVGLFLLTQQRGLGSIKLHPLTLQANFRSSPVVIDWINKHFPSVFSNEANVTTGSICFTPSVASRLLDSQHNVKLSSFQHEHEHEQANEILKIIRQTREQSSDAKIAILVRSRSHLTDILPILRKANLKFKALDIDPLEKRPVIQDLIVLTHALHHLSDRLAWLSLLRAPWCGLLLQDMLVISNNPNEPIWHSLNSNDAIHKMSQDGQARVNRILPHLTTALAERRRYPLREWIEHTWIQMGGPACLTQSSDLEDANAFFNLLEKLDESYCLKNPDQLTQALKKLYAASDNTANDHLQVMTIHNAKGLEFDVVILPHLERSPSHDKSELLQWMEGADESLLLAPIPSVSDTRTGIIDYIKRQHAIKADNEISRLLYVAVTRAKNQLYLLFNVKCDEKNNLAQPTAGSLLRKLWKSISSEVIIQENKLQSDSNNQNSPYPLKRLHQNWIPIAISNKFAIHSKYHNKPGFSLMDTAPAIIGSIIHRIFELIPLQSLRELDEAHFRAFIKQELLQHGLTDNHSENAYRLINLAISNTLTDPRGQWILKAHTEMATEMPISAVINGKVKHLIIDRTFVDEQGNRWIIDYKTAACMDHNDIQEFLNVQKAKYQQQLLEYAKAFSAIESRPIRLGLYFPLVPAWIELDTVIFFAKS